MSRTTDEPSRDQKRVAKWRAGLIEDLGPDLRQCVEWMHDASPDGLVIVLRSARRCGVPEVIQQGISLYWRELSARKRGETIVV